MSDLIKLAQLYKANKYEMAYIDVYESYFKDIKDKKLKILEIGIDKGPSLIVWSEYFKNSNHVTTPPISDGSHHIFSKS